MNNCDLIHIYSIRGMICEGCRSRIEDALNGIDGISARVTLTPGEALLRMEKYLTTDELQKVLLTVGSYKIRMSGFLNNRE